MRRGSRDYADFSWLSAALGGRFTGSGSIFAGSDNKSFTDTLKARAEEALQKSKDDLRRAGATVVSGAVDAASPGAVILTRNTQLVILAAAIGAFLYFRKKT